MTRRNAVALLLLLPIAIGLGTETTANATTITANPNGIISCHIAFSTTSGAAWTTGTINVNGDCSATPFLTGAGAPPQTGSACAAYDTCGASSAYDIGPIGFEFAYWTGTYEITGYGITEDPGADTWNQFETDYCGFDGNGDVAFNDTPTTATSTGFTSAPGSEDYEKDTTATTTLDSLLVSNAEPTCTTAERSATNVYIGVDNAGTTDTGTWSALDMDGTYCNGHPTDTPTCWAPAPNDEGVIDSGTLAPTSNDDVSPDCDLVSVTGNTSEPTQATGISYDYSVTFGGAADYIVAIDDAYSGAATTIKGKSFDLANIADVDPGPDLTSPQSVEFIAATGDVVNPDLWCYSADTGWVDWGTVAALQGLNPPPEPINPPGGGQDAACFASAGWTWDDPVSWVLGGLHDTECLLQALLEPSICSGSAFEPSLTSCIGSGYVVADLQTKIPTGYIAQAVTAMTTMYDGVNTQLGTSACDTPTIDPWAGKTGTFAALSSLNFQIPGPSTDGCSMAGATYVGDMSPWITFLIDFMTFGVWMAAAAILWKMMPWHRPGDGIEIVEQFGGLSDHYMENGVEVYQTNEGSD